MSEKHIIKLADGTEYTADLNGNNYVIDKDVREHFTDTNIASATVDGVSKGILILDSVRYEESKTWVVFHEQTPQEKEKADTKADIGISLSGIDDLGAVVSDLVTAIDDLSAALAEKE